MALRTGLAILALQLVSASQSTVNVFLQSDWEAAPIALEFLESCYIDNPASYFPILFDLSHHVSRIEAARNSKEMFEEVIDIMLAANTTIQGSSLDITSVKSSVAMHVSAPKLEAYYQYYRTAVNVTMAGKGVGQICEDWVEWRGKGFCDVESLRADLELTLSEDDKAHNGIIYPHPKILSFDHIYPNSFPTSNPESSSPAILYFSTFSNAQANLLFYLVTHHDKDPNFRFVVRYRPSLAEGPRRKNSLKGYGVEMVLKKTDYLVIDDRDTGGSGVGKVDAVPAARKNASAEVDEIEAYLGEDPWAELETPLKASEIADLGMKTASFILLSQKPLDMLVKVSQDFPKLSAAIARRIQVDPEIEDEILQNRRVNGIGKVTPSIWINGKLVNTAETDIYKFLDIIREEKKTMESLISLGLEAEEAYELLLDEKISDAMTTVDPMDALVDASDRQEGGGVILWWNDIEKDQKYSSFPNNIAQMMRTPFQGQLIPIKRNLWNVILVLDLSNKAHIAQISQTVKMLITRRVPIRFGLVPLIAGGDDDASWKIFEMVHIGVKKYNRAFAMDFLLRLGEVGGSTSVDSAQAKRLFDEMDREYADQKEEAPAAVSVLTNLESKIVAWLDRVGASVKQAPSGHCFFNGMPHEYTATWTQTLMSDYIAQLQYLQANLGASDILKISRYDNYFYDLPTTSKLRNVHIVPKTGGTGAAFYDLTTVFPTLETSSTQYIYADPVAVASVTLRILADLDSDDGRKLASNALEYLQSNAGQTTRLALIHLPGGNEVGLSAVLCEMMSTSTYSTTSPAALSYLVATDFANGATSKKQEGSDPQSRTPSCWIEQADSLRYTLGLEFGSSYVMLNGRLIGPVMSSDFGAADFAALRRFEGKKSINAVALALSRVYQDADPSNRALHSDMIASVSSILALANAPASLSLMSEPPNPRLDVTSRMQGSESIILTGEEKRGPISIYAVLDPLSELTQKWAAILQHVSKLRDVSIELRLSPNPSLKQIPIKRFYRYNVQDEPDFDVDGDESKTAASFVDLPGEPIFTLGMDVAPSWIVSPRSSVHDLDNLRLDAIASRQGSSVVDVTFELEQFAVAGHAMESQNVPPRGLQLQLHDLQGNSLADTQIMANLGYFQLKANPGITQLSIRPGRGRDIYYLSSMTDDSGYRTASDTLGEVSLTTFGGLTLYPRMDRKPGMELTDVLEVDSTRRSTGGIFGKVVTAIASVFQKPLVPPQPKADINIFTVASGMLYERFASIMILSVLRHTNSVVKFWFIENFLSPTFLEFLPHFAQEYGFQYEVVTYRWPSWLRAQKEKQREIWAYKILFLDVLFPMDLDKVLFVDADQIVRTDLKELVDLDLRGRVYGYAPMGDDKPEMEGFRFWKTGYWKDSLRGRPYHISALYVIDLKRFRQVAAGDRLRAQYQALSADPNSLANLDQDLPNSMQDVIPIYTLDRSWLWCETWCSQESLKDAKTIDLCQNPLTKEPKLERARKIPEWDEYDREVAAFTKKLQGKQAGDVSGQVGSADDLEALAVVQEPIVSDGDTTMEDGTSEIRIADEL